MATEHLTILDSTLRDGAQGEGISFSVQDKISIVKALDSLGIDLVEAGNPGSNPKDLEFFREASRLPLEKARLVAFGSTRRVGVPMTADEGFRSLLDAGTETVMIFGKSWDFHVKHVLRASHAENLAMIGESCAAAVAEGRRVIYDAEHFFDGYASDPDYAMRTLAAAVEARAECIVLCDTNGGSLPERVAELTALVRREFSPGVEVGVHAHNDAGLAVANSLAAVRAGAPDLLTLHIDNVNPGTIARHEEAAREALAAIVAGHTPGDVAAFGMETADPAVVAANNLKASPDEVFRAIEVTNEVGGGRADGIPELLPGLNFVLGLSGETPATYDLDLAFLRRVLDANLLVRRINIRRLMPFPGTRAHAENTLDLHDREFRAFKETVRDEIDRPMLERVFPIGSVVRHSVVERTGTLSLARPLGSYPILLGLPLALPVGTVLDAVVVDHGQRSVTALPCPVPVNTLPLAALRWLPGVGKKRAAAVAAKRPFRSLEAWRRIAGTTPLDKLLDLA